MEPAHRATQSRGAGPGGIACGPTAVYAARARRRASDRRARPDRRAVVGDGSERTGRRDRGPARAGLRRDIHGAARHREHRGPPGVRSGACERDGRRGVAGGAFGFATLDANGLDDRAHMVNELSELVSLMTTTCIIWRGSLLSDAGVPPLAGARRKAPARLRSPNACSARKAGPARAWGDTTIPIASRAGSPGLRSSPGERSLRLRARRRSRRRRREAPAARSCVPRDRRSSTRGRRAGRTS